MVKYTGPDALSRAFAHATEWLDGLDSRSVAPTVGLETLRNRLGGPMPRVGTDPGKVIDELAAATEGGHIGSASGRFFAWVVTAKQRVRGVRGAEGARKGGARGADRPNVPTLL